MARYFERAEQCLRLLRTVLESNPHAFDVNARIPRVCAGELLGVLAQFTGTSTTIGSDPGDRVERLPELLTELFDPGRFGNLAHAFSAALQAAQAVRDRLDGDAWRMLHTLRARLAGLCARGRGAVPALLDEIDASIDALAALAGLLGETLIRGQSWLFLDLGKRLERGLALVALLKLILLGGREPPHETLLLEALLRVSASHLTFHRRYAARPEFRGVLSLLFTEAAHPRSLAYQVLCLQEHAQALPADPERRSGAVQALVREAVDAVSLAQAPEPSQDPAALRQSLLSIVSRLGQLLAQCSDALGECYFTDRYGPQPLVGSESVEV